MTNREQKLQNIKTILKEIQTAVEKEMDTGNLDELNPLEILVAAVSTISISAVLQNKGMTPEQVVDAIKSGKVDDYLTGSSATESRIDEIEQALIKKKTKKETFH